MPHRLKVSTRRENKLVHLELDVVIPVGVRLEELLVKGNWHGPQIRTKKFSLMQPILHKIKAKYVGRTHIFKEDRIA